MENNRLFKVVVSNIILINFCVLETSSQLVVQHLGLDEGTLIVDLLYGSIIDIDQCTTHLV